MQRKHCTMKNKGKKFLVCNNQKYQSCHKLLVQLFCFCLHAIVHVPLLQRKNVFLILCEPLGTLGHKTK